MWKQPDKFRWKYIRKVDWEALAPDQAKNPDDPMLKSWVDALTEKYEELSRKCNLPKIGRDAVLTLEEGTVHGGGGQAG